jgi:magnesium transporter
MNEEDNKPAEEFPHYEDVEQNDLQIGLPDSFIREIHELLREQYIDRIQEISRDLSGPDAAELIFKTPQDLRYDLVDILEDIIPPDTFSYLNYEVMNDLLKHMTAGHIASIVNALESDDAIRLIDDLDDRRRAEILRLLSRKVRAAVEEGLTYREETAGRLMQREFVAIPQFWTVGKTVDYLRAAAEALPEKFYDIFIVDPMHRLVGSVALDNILCTQRNVKMDVITNEEHVTVPIDMDQEQIAHLFRRKDLLSAPVVDAEGRLVGVITVDDVVDIIDQEAEEDLLKMGGVTDSDIHRSVFATTKSRFIWLLVNLATAIVAALVIGMFENAIQQIVALAALMPIVASMGGNAGTQTLAIAVRALATKELSGSNTWRIVVKEFMVGSINGVIFAIMMGALTWWWYGDMRLGSVIAAAMVVNLMAAGLSGIIIPVAIARLGMDPATSATVFLTTITDVIGFFAFLGLATVFLL